MFRVCDYDFSPGEIYIFSILPQSQIPMREVMGIFDRREQGRIWLEVATTDIRRFCYDKMLPPEYVYVREANRAEIFAFGFNYGYAESLRKMGIRLGCEWKLL